MNFHSSRSRKRPIILASPPGPSDSAVETRLFQSRFYAPDALMAASSPVGLDETNQRDNDPQHRQRATQQPALRARQRIDGPVQ